jgi:hypothetical protein
LRLAVAKRGSKARNRILKNSKAGIFLSGKREGGNRDRLGNDQDIEFQEIKIGVFQEIKTLFWRSKVSF